ncbi:MAG: LysR family transcriptional regulator [Hespellia sp.]|nr:LysR family transcriptional regulator [Hespellia sp.]
MLDFRIHTFLEVCKTMNYTKAGQNLSITQPAVSQHIRYLENYYGHKLFESRGKKIYLTPAGETLYNAVSTMAHDEIHLQKQLDCAPKKERKLVFGVTMTIGEYAIAPHLSRYIRNHPTTSVHIIVANTQALLEKLSNREIDFAIVEGYFSKKEYDYRSYAKVPFIGVCHADHQFADQSGRGSITLEELFQERLIVRERGSGTREIFEKALGEKNFAVSDFPHLVEINSMNAIKMLVEEDAGITFLYQSAVEKELKAGSLREILIRDFKQSHDFTFIWNKGSIFSEEYNQLFEELK